MTAADLIRELRSLGVTLAANGDRLRFSPRSAVTGELLQRLRDSKAELLAMLASGSQEMLPTGNKSDLSTTVEKIEVVPFGTKSETSPVGDVPETSPNGDKIETEGAARKYLDSDAGEWLDLTAPDGRRCLVRSDAADLQVIDLPAPCPVCGGIVFWWDAAGGAHCERCSPAPGRGRWLVQRAAEVRDRYPVVRDRQPAAPARDGSRTRPATVPSGILADPIPTCSDCGRPRSVVPGQSGRLAELCFRCWGKRRSETGYSERRSLYGSS